jgi:alpha-ketoglutarate-dependent taurine dioxygenase
MKEAKLQPPEIKRGMRKTISSSVKNMVETEYLPDAEGMPLIVRPTVRGINANAWAEHQRDFIQAQLTQHGALLFRNFNLTTAEEFRLFVQAISGELIEYEERSSPRSKVGRNVYTSTDYPAEQSIFPHNEHSYSMTFPLRLYFFCLTPAQQGGETPLVNCRRVLERISQPTREKFRQYGWMYVRNLGDGLGLSWQKVFQTQDKAAVEDYCRAANIEFEWKDGDRLRLRQVRPAFAEHPRTGEMVWFNHATFFHVSTLEPGIREGLLTLLDEEDLPNNTYYGDGSPLEPAALDELREAYLQERVAFTWQRGDVLLVDNMLTAHSRMPYTGLREVLVAMAEPFTRQDIARADIP